ARAIRSAWSFSIIKKRCYVCWVKYRVKTTNGTANTKGKILSAMRRHWADKRKRTTPEEHDDARAKRTARDADATSADHGRRQRTGAGPRHSMTRAIPSSATAIFMSCYDMTDCKFTVHAKGIDGHRCPRFEGQGRSARTKNLRHDQQIIRGKRPHGRL